VSDGAGPGEGVGAARAGLDRLWAGWRSTYIQTITDDPTPVRPDETGSLFERVLALDDATGLVVHRGGSCSVVLNAFPYTNGHCMVLPNRAVADLDDLGDDEHHELWATVRQAVRALRAAYGCDGVNVGVNLGAAAGAGVPDHVHVHVLPRWSGDSNFMTTVAEARVLPEPLSAAWERLRDAWSALA
jgi:ATP adenylyltransferase